MKKKLLIPFTAITFLLIGGVAGATSSTLTNYGEGLKENYSAQAEEFRTNFELYDLPVYTEEKSVQLDGEADAYFEEQKAAYVAERKGDVDAEYTAAKESVFAHIDTLFE